MTTVRPDECSDQQSMRDYLEWYKRHYVGLIVALMPEKPERRSDRDHYMDFKSACNFLGIHSGVITPLKAKAGKAGKAGKGKGSGKDSGKSNVSVAMLDLVAKKLDNFTNKLLQKVGTLAEIQDPHQLLQTGTLLLGADVRHEEGAASLAGMVAAFTSPFTHYFATCRAQMPKQAAEGERQRQSKEHIGDVAGMVEDLLELYRKHVPERNGIPERVVMIRDGVSEGQFEKHCEEIEALIESLPAVDGVRPEVAWIVVQKRHQTRLFPDKDRGAQALPNGNIKPGIVADVGIAHPKYENWFAVSHKAIQGTAVPGHYFLLKNTTRYGKDDFVVLMNQLCHLYPKAPCAVS